MTKLLTSKLLGSEPARSRRGAVSEDLMLRERLASSLRFALLRESQGGPSGLVDREMRSILN